MLTITAPRPKVKPARRCGLTLSICGTKYRVRPIPAGEFGTRAYRLSKLAADGAVYDVIRSHHGLVECDCPDYEARRRGLTTQPCKHGAALVAVGMLDAPRVAR